MTQAMPNDMHWAHATWDEMPKMIAAARDSAILPIGGTDHGHSDTDRGCEISPVGHRARSAFERIVSMAPLTFRHTRGIKKL